MADSQDFLPEWGLLPVEQYLITALSCTNNRGSGDYIAALAVRYRAQKGLGYSQCNRGHPVLLRTWYDPADDERVGGWATISEEYANDAPWAILGDPELFSFGSNWRLIYNILSEIAVPPTEVFEEGTLGEKYVVAAGNELDRELYRRTREDLEDDPPLDSHDT